MCRTLPAILLGPALALCVLGCDREAGGPPAPAAGGYILISIDTLRADHLGLYGYQRDTSPFLDALGARSVVFDHAFAQIPGTLPSHMSLFTGLYPEEHGVYPPDGVLPEGIVSLPELFRRAGYRTAGFTEGGYVAGRYGFARGFEEFSDAHTGEESDVERTLQRGLSFLERHGAEPFFLFLHTYAVHDPYRPPPGYAERYWQEPPVDTFPPTGPELTAYNRRGGRPPLPPRAVEYYQALYDGSIRYVDDVLARFFARLEAMELAASTTVIVTSDHGEEFLEHGRFVHEQVYRESVHVPLLVYGPGFRPRRVGTPVELVDLAPTLVELARLKAPAAASAFSGETLAPLIRGGPEPRRASAYAASFLDPVRTLVVAEGGRLHQLLRYQGRNDREGTWISLTHTFDPPADGRLRLQALSFHEARELAVVAGGDVLATADLRPKEWRQLTMDLPPARLSDTVSLRTEGCTVPRDIGFNDDARCLSFRVKGLPIDRSELYDLLADPAQQTNLGASEPALAERLRTALERLDLRPRTDRQAAPLDPALEQRLRALGYLQ
jgi:hypothetical protein